MQHLFRVQNDKIKYYCIKKLKMSQRALTCNSSVQWCAATCGCPQQSYKTHWLHSSPPHLKLSFNTNSRIECKPPYIDLECTLGHSSIRSLCRKLTLYCKNAKTQKWHLQTKDKLISPSDARPVIAKATCTLRKHPRFGLVVAILSCQVDF